MTHKYETNDETVDILDPLLSLLFRPHGATIILVAKHCIFAGERLMAERTFVRIGVDLSMDAREMALHVRDACERRQASGTRAVVSLLVLPLRFVPFPYAAAAGLTARAAWCQCVIIVRAEGIAIVGRAPDLLVVTRQRVVFVLATVLVVIVTVPLVSSLPVIYTRCLSPSNAQIQRVIGGGRHESRGVIKGIVR